MASRRVLLVTDWNRGRGGAEAYVGWLRDGLRAAGDEVSLLTSSAGTAGDGTADIVAYGTEQVAAQALLQIVNPFAVAAAARAMRELRPDVVWVNMFAHHLSPATLYALRGAPIVLMVSDYKLVCPIGSKLLPDGSLCSVQPGWVCRTSGCVGLPHWIRDQARYALIGAATRLVTRVLACSRWVQGELAASGLSSEVLLLPVPRPSSSFRRAPAADPLFVFGGRLDVEKGVMLLLRAFARVRADVPSARLRVVGDGPLRQSLARLAAELGLGDAVELLGWLPPEGVEHQLRDAWALVAPSLWAEPLGLVAAEAIVRGVPVIASESGGLCEIVEPGAGGLLFPNGDENALHERMLAIAKSRVFADHVLSDSVVRRAQDTFDVDRHVTHVRRVFAEVVDRGGARRAG